MTTKQMLDAFSDTLMQDERILSAPERELLTSLLQNARAAANGNPQTRAAVTAAISQALGETVEQRAFAVLGSSMWSGFWLTEEKMQRHLKRCLQWRHNRQRARTVQYEVRSPLRGQ